MDFNTRIFASLAEHGHHANKPYYIHDSIYTYIIHIKCCICWLVANLLRSVDSQHNISLGKPGLELGVAWWCQPSVCPGTAVCTPGSGPNPQNGTQASQQNDVCFIMVYQQGTCWGWMTHQYIWQILRIFLFERNQETLSTCHYATYDIHIQFYWTG